MALEIVHTERSYMVVDDERGHWTPQFLYNSYLNARKFALAWRVAAKHWRMCWKLRNEDYNNLREITR